jgi:hypothetical protein
VPDLRFSLESVDPAPHSAVPALNFKLRIENAPAEEAIESVLLQCQIRIEATRRRYTAAEQEKLHDLFGEPADWSRTLRAMLWTHSHANVPSFRASTVVDLPVACTFDLTIASAKYFHGLEDGAVPVTVLFSGTVFTAPATAGFRSRRFPGAKRPPPKCRCGCGKK